MIENRSIQHKDGLNVYTKDEGMPKKLYENMLLKDPKSFSDGI